VHEIRLALAGAMQLARADPSGLVWFDASIDGFWRSFRAALICYPLYLVLLGFRVTPAQVAASSFGRIVTVETIGYAIAWVAFPLLILPLTRVLDRENRFLLFMVAYNWCQVPQTMLFVLIAIGGAVVPQGLAQFAEIGGAVAVLVYEWFIARSALSVTSAPAALVVLIDVLLGTILSRVTEGLY
jgi:hypothetical protein